MPREELKEPLPLQAARHRRRGFAGNGRILAVEKCDQITGLDPRYLLATPGADFRTEPDFAKGADRHGSGHAGPAFLCKRRQIVAVRSTKEMVQGDATFAGRIIPQHIAI
ncbi:hypothetical protein B7486_20290 [cyanobacterium TDX16]|nr:hypothetical protein B7486_20290 [cyanobacterium TDX16]